METKISKVSFVSDIFFQLYHKIQQYNILGDLSFAPWARAMPSLALDQEILEVFFFSERILDTLELQLIAGEVKHTMEWF